MESLSRRVWLRWAGLTGAASWFTRSLWAARGAFLMEALARDPLAGTQAGTRIARARRYRADAVITLFSIPIFSRQGVGSGYATWEEHQRDGARSLCLQFAAGSWPERTRGLNRVGFIQENLLERGAELASSTYFGFMTTSTEQSIDQARKSLGNVPGKAVPYSAAHGSTQPGHYSGGITRFQSPQDFNWSQWEKLLPYVRGLFANAETEEQQAVVRGETAPQPFLHAVTRAMLAPAATVRQEYVYGSDRYRLDVEKKPDEKVAAKLASQLSAKGRRVLRVTGKTTHLKSGKTSQFRTWIEEGDCLPLRIEYQARSFLHLAFEVDPKLTTPAMSFQWTQNG